MLLAFRAGLKGEGYRVTEAQLSAIIGAQFIRGVVHVY